MLGQQENSTIFPQNNFTAERKSINNITMASQIVDAPYIIYTGIPNAFATKLVLMLMGFMVTLIFLCIFLLLTIYICYKEKGEKLFTDNKDEPTSVKIDKANSPYIITPEQKITQQLLATQIVTPIECSANDIAQLLRYIALYGEFSEDEIYRTPRIFIRLVERGKTKFDEQDSKREHKAARKSESKLDLHKEVLITTKKLKKNIQQQGISSSKAKKEAHRKKSSSELNNVNETERNRKKNGSMKRSKKEKNGKRKSSKSRLNHQLVEVIPHMHEELPKLRKKQLKRMRKEMRKNLARKGKDRFEIKRKKRKHLEESKHPRKREGY
ncbi:Protein HLR1 [Dirofilaria immitis]